MRPLKRPSDDDQKKWLDERGTRAAKQHLEESLDNGTKPEDLDSKEHFKPAWRESTWKGKLVEVQDGLCAWCTVKPRRGGHPGTIDHIRPKTEVHRHFERKKDGSREFLPKKGLPGYYWRAYDPLNFVFACSDCNTIKSTLWPVRPWKDPASWKAPVEGQAEDELLLDPFLDDFDPFNHFRFGPSGALMFREGDESAEATWEVVDLERDGLCEGREEACKRISSDVRALKHAMPDMAANEACVLAILAENCAWKSPHAAYYRAALKAELQANGLQWSDLQAAWSVLGLGQDISEPPNDAWVR